MNVAQAAGGLRSAHGFAPVSDTAAAARHVDGERVLSLGSTAAPGNVGGGGGRRGVAGSPQEEEEEEEEEAAHMEERLVDAGNAVITPNRSVLTENDGSNGAGGSFARGKGKRVKFLADCAGDDDQVLLSNRNDKDGRNEDTAAGVGDRRGPEAVPRSIAVSTSGSVKVPLPNPKSVLTSPSSCSSSSSTFNTNLTSPSSNATSATSSSVSTPITASDRLPASSEMQDNNNFSVCTSSMLELSRVLAALHLSKIKSMESIAEDRVEAVKELLDVMEESKVVSEWDW